MGPATTPGQENKKQEDLKMFNSKGVLTSLPKHSYWFDFWVFVVFDIAFFFVMYFLVP
ncbi:hypothetical protein PAMP_014823 [Pampus punctatissimus]